MGRRWGVRPAVELLLDELGAAGLLDWSRASVDSASGRAVRGDLGGANPVDRAKRGCKWHLAVERAGMVLSLLLGPANRPDQELFAEVVGDIPMVATPPVAGAGGPSASTPTRGTTRATAAPT